MKWFKQWWDNQYSFIVKLISILFIIAIVVYSTVFIVGLLTGNFLITDFNTILKFGAITIWILFFIFWIIVNQATPKF